MIGDKFLKLLSHRKVNLLTRLQIRWRDLDVPDTTTLYESSHQSSQCRQHGWQVAQIVSLIQKTRLFLVPKLRGSAPTELPDIMICCRQISRIFVMVFRLKHLDHSIFYNCKCAKNRSSNLCYCKHKIFLCILKKS